jgi:hypothetical protein
LGDDLRHARIITRQRFFCDRDMETAPESGENHRPLVWNVSKGDHTPYRYE